jgi:hypothetical protein
MKKINYVEFYLYTPLGDAAGNDRPPNSASCCSAPQMIDMAFYQTPFKGRD